MTQETIGLDRSLIISLAKDISPLSHDSRHLLLYPV